MTLRKTIFSALTIIACGNVPVVSAGEATKKLYCSGKSAHANVPGGTADTDALVRISGSSLYVEIVGVGSGRSNAVPVATDSIQVQGDIIIKRETNGGEMRAIYFLNRYSGQLYIFPAQQEASWLFGGVCNSAVPLF